MNGAITAHTPIAVDTWTRQAVAHCRLFFLTHAHTDHTAGLTKSWKKHKIYCSEVTKDIVVHKLGVNSDLLVGLPVDQPTSIPLDEYGKETMTVTLIDANHCPGAVMFLFQGYFGCFLYTGDFRYCKAISDHPSLKSVTVDRLFLDNTYCNPNLTFPRRSQACQEVIEIVQDYFNKGFHIVFGMNTLGKEDLLLEVAKTCQTFIGVDHRRLELLKVLRMPDIFTDDMESTQVKVVMQREVTKDKLEQWNVLHPTIAILPTSRFEGDINPYQFMSTVFVIPVSDHSSFSELECFVSAIKPKTIVPIVKKHKTSTGNEYTSRADMNVFSKYLNEEPLAPIGIPNTVLEAMSATNCVKRRKTQQYPRSSYYMKKMKRCSGVVFPDELSDQKEETISSEVELSLHVVNKSNCQPISTNSTNTQPDKETTQCHHEENRFTETCTCSFVTDVEESKAENCEKKAAPITHTLENDKDLESKYATCIIKKEPCDITPKDTLDQYDNSSINNIDIKVSVNQQWSEDELNNLSKKKWCSLDFVTNDNCGKTSNKTNHKSPQNSTHSSDTDGPMSPKPKKIIRYTSRKPKYPSKPQRKRKHATSTTSSAELQPSATLDSYLVSEQNRYQSTDLFYASSPSESNDNLILEKPSKTKKLSKEKKSQTLSTGQKRSQSTDLDVAASYSESSDVILEKPSKTKKLLKKKKSHTLSTEQKRSRITDLHGAASHLESNDNVISKTKKLSKEKKSQTLSTRQKRSRSTNLHGAASHDSLTLDTFYHKVQKDKEQEEFCWFTTERLNLNKLDKW